MNEIILIHILDVASISMDKCSFISLVKIAFCTTKNNWEKNPTRCKGHGTPHNILDQLSRGPFLHPDIMEVLRGQNNKEVALH
jgi:hypothetical protein